MLISFGVPCVAHSSSLHHQKTSIGLRDLTRVALSLAGHGQLSILNAQHRHALATYGNVTVGKLSEAATVRKILGKLRDELGQRHYARAIGEYTLGLVDAAKVLDATSPRNLEMTSSDRHNMLREWGLWLLPSNDPAFRDTNYLPQYLRESEQTASAFLRSKQDTPIRRAFNRAWHRLSPRSTPVAFTLNGSDANNLLYSVALKNARNRLGPQVNDAELLFLSNMYAAGRGRFAGAGFRGFGADGAPRLGRFRIVSPHGIALTDRPVSAKQQQMENYALRSIDRRLRRSEPIGGLVIEPILGAKGVYVYPLSFMRSLRDLCDAHGIPIIADEILTGGRTGRFFGFEHYRGFEPDFVTFGKGLQVAGLAVFKRTRNVNGTIPRYDIPTGMDTTVHVNRIDMLKATQVLSRIDRDSLLKNATDVGADIRERLNRFEQKHGVCKSQQSRGLGMLMYTNVEIRGVRKAHNRLMPFLSLSHEDVADIFADENMSISDASVD